MNKASLLSVSQSCNELPKSTIRSSRRMVNTGFNDTSFDATSNSFLNSPSLKDGVKRKFKFVKGNHDTSSNKGTKKLRLNASENKIKVLKKS